MRTWDLRSSTQSYAPLLSDNETTSERDPLVTNDVLTRILVIDDDQAMTEMLRLVLEPSSFDVYEAHSGPEGIEATRQLNPEVVVLDLLMPDMDGWEVCKEIRTFSQVPILVLSAISKPGIVARALDEGADDYLLKPMPSSVLIAHLKRLARRARAEQESTNNDINYYGV
jgi:two-component system KDP operon response regulator KdpE